MNSRQISPTPWVRTRTQREPDGTSLQLWRRATSAEIDEAKREGIPVHLITTEESWEPQREVGNGG